MIDLHHSLFRINECLYRSALRSLKGQRILFPRVDFLNLEDELSFGPLHRSANRDLHLRTIPGTSCPSIPADRSWNRVFAAIQLVCRDNDRIRRTRVALYGHLTGGLPYHQPRRDAQSGDGPSVATGLCVGLENPSA